MSALRVWSKTNRASIEKPSPVSRLQCVRSRDCSVMRLDSVDRPWSVMATPRKLSVRKAVSEVSSARPSSVTALEPDKSNVCSPTKHDSQRRPVSVTCSLSSTVWRRVQCVTASRHLSFMRNPVSLCSEVKGCRKLKRSSVVSSRQNVNSSKLHSGDVAFL